jgi:hypothetical protein
LFKFLPTIDDFCSQRNTVPRNQDEAFSFWKAKDVVNNLVLCIYLGVLKIEDTLLIKELRQHDTNISHDVEMLLASQLRLASNLGPFG